MLFFHFSLGIVNLCCLVAIPSKTQWVLLFHGLPLFSEFCQASEYPFAIESCLLINGPQNLNQQSKGYHTAQEFSRVLMFHKNLNNRQYLNILPGVRISATCQIQVDCHAFRFLQTFYLDKTGCIFKLRDWRLQLMFQALLR